MRRYLNSGLKDCRYLSLEQRREARKEVVWVGGEVKKASVSAVDSHCLQRLGASLSCLLSALSHAIAP